jgi:hypothetical protein
MNPLCRGCRYSKLGDVRAKSICIIAKLQIEGKCPCINCLVKVMCNKQCDIRISRRRELDVLKSVWKGYPENM